MSQKVLVAGSGVVVFVLALIAGCQGVSLEVKAIKDTAVAVKQDVEAQLPVIEEAVNALPEGEAKVQAQKDLDAARQKLVEANEVIAKADAVLTSLETGVLDPALASGLVGIPGGVYIMLALTAAGALAKHLKAKETTGDLRAVVQAWEDVGPPLTVEEKRDAAEIQGEATTARVHAIKTELARRA